MGSGDSHKIVRIASRCLHRTDRWHCSPFFCTRQRFRRPGANNIPPNGEISPTGEYKEGVAVGPWMLYPSIFVGGVYNSNFNQAATAANTDSGWSLRVAPRLIATSTDGAIHSTTLYGVGDFQFFNGNTVSCRRGMDTKLQPNPRCHAQFQFKVHARDQPFHQRLKLQQQRDWAEWDAACYHPDHRQSFRNDHPASIQLPIIS